jgi:hypothetical protein
MGGSSPEEDEELFQREQEAAAAAAAAAPPPVPEATFLGADTTNEEGEVQENPESAAEANLYTLSNAKCAWSDANEYSFRLRQVELINHLIRSLATELYKEEDLINFDTVHKMSMEYKNAFGRSDEAHSWSILAEDPLFIPQDREETFFKTYQNFFQENAGATNSVKRDRFQQFLGTFNRLRDRLVVYMFKNCKTVIPPPPPPPVLAEK